MWFAGAVIFLLFIWHLCQKHYRDAVKNIPGPFTLPLLGSVFVYPTLRSENMLQKFGQTAADHGSVFKIWVFNQMYIVSSDAELTGQLLSSSTNINKVGPYRVLNALMGHGIIRSGGKKWRSRRKAITPTFHFKAMDQYVEIFDHQANILVDCLRSKADGKTVFNVYPDMADASFEAIVESSMGLKKHGLSEPNMEFTDAFHELAKLTGWRIGRMYAFNEVIFSIMYPKLKWRQTKLANIINSFSRKIIEKRREDLEKSMSSPNNAQPTENESESKKLVTLVDVLLQSSIDGKKLSTDDIVEELHTFIAAGYETSATVLSFALFLLARHPEVQNKLVAELDSVFGAEENVIITQKELNSLNYTESVLRETLRLYPSVPLISRRIIEDIKYEHSRYGHVFIPIGTEFIINIHRSMHDPKLYENPEDFIPERHNNATDNKFAFIAFSSGPRNCIGRKYAMLQTKVYLAKVVREYEILPFGEDVSPSMDVVMRSVTGMQVGLRPRSHKL